MLRHALIEHCAPTLAGIKTGRVFSVKTGGADIVPEIRSLNRILVMKGLRLIPLRRTQTHTMIYVYRPDALRDDLVFPEAAGILEEKGETRTGVWSS